VEDSKNAVNGRTGKEKMIKEPLGLTGKELTVSTQREMEGGLYTIQYAREIPSFKTRRYLSTGVGFGLSIALCCTEDTEIVATSLLG
jgi:hypothetical protein